MGKAKAWIGEDKIALKVLTGKPTEKRSLANDR